MAVVVQYRMDGAFRTTGLSKFIQSTYRWSPERNAGNGWVYFKSVRNYHTPEEALQDLTRLYPEVTWRAFCAA